MIIRINSFSEVEMWSNSFFMSKSGYVSVSVPWSTRSMPVPTSWSESWSWSRSFSWSSSGSWSRSFSRSGNWRADI